MREVLRTTTIPAVISVIAEAATCGALRPRQVSQSKVRAVWVSRRSSPGAAPEHGSGLGQVPLGPFEQTFALLHWFRRPGASVGRSATNIHEAFLRLACAIICLRRVDQPGTLLGVHLPGFPRSDRPDARRSPGECRKGPARSNLGARRPTISSPRTPTCQPTRNTGRSSRSPCATSGSLTSGSKDDAEAPKATGRVGAVLPEQDKAEVVRAVTDQAGDRCRHVCRPPKTARDHRPCKPFSCGRAAAIPPPPTSTRPVGSPMWYPPMASSSSARDPVMRFSAVGDVVARKPVCQPTARAEAWSGQQLSRYSD